MAALKHSFAILGMLLFVIALGCSGPAAKHDDHDHDHGHSHAGEKHAHPESYAAAIKQLGELRDKIRDAFAKKETKDADEHVHEVGELLEEVGELAEKEKFNAPDVLAVKTLVSELTDHFEEVDKTLHGEKGKSWDEVAKAIDAAITKLAQKSAAK